ncbi:MAG: ATP-binding protein [Deltaproteobacteria bacterium]|nr:ATP-binding protein [Deltaproteobacteria bacterium]
MLSAFRQTLTEKLADSLSDPLPTGTLRRVWGPSPPPGKATAVVGMRRAGKTTYVHQLRRERIQRGAGPDQLPYVNFEDERLAGVTAAHLAFLVEEHARRCPDALDRGTVTWCLDEIQLVPGWESFVRRLLDAGNREVVVTGSSAALLSREVATALRGRGWEVPIYPFGFGEALVHLGHSLPERPEFLTARERARLERHFSNWLTVGGFPEAQGLEHASRRQLLRDYVDVAILRDVVERHRVSNVSGLRWLVRHLLGNAGALFSVEKFYAALKSQGIAIAKDTVHQLLGHLDDCFLVRPVWMESASERQRMVNLRKVYPVDQGFIPLFDRSGRRNIGHALETAVLVELERRRFDVTYVRTPSGHEVDFLARDGLGGELLVQVCADISEPATAQRELRALAEAGKLYPGASRHLLTLTREDAPAGAPPDVLVQPAYEWLLAPGPT